MRLLILNKLRILCVVLVANVLIWGNGLAQTKLDDPTMVSTMDSIARFASEKWVVDSLKIVAWSNDLRAGVLQNVKRDSLRFQAKLDSLKKLSRPLGRLRYQVDSLMQKKDAILRQVDATRDSLLTRTRGKFDEWTRKVTEKLAVSTSIPTEIAGANLPGMESLDMDVQIPDGLSIPDLTSMPELELPTSTNLLPDYHAVADRISLPSAQRELNSLSREISPIKEVGSIQELTADPATFVESKVSEVGEVKAVTDELAQATAIENSELLQRAEMFKDPEQMANEAQQTVVKKAINHFAGKEKVLEGAMEQMQKYKSRYENLNSLSEAKHLPRNSMTGKPFVERLIPGLAFQFLKNPDVYLLDINPYVGYRVSGRITSGMGWNQRIGYSRHENKMSSGSVIYGPRVFTEINIWRGFKSRIEVEWMNTTVPSVVNVSSMDESNREWVFTPLMGLKKDYGIFRSLKGTFMLMFNLYNPLHKSPYGDLIYSRIGFELSLHAKEKRTHGTTK